MKKYGRQGIRGLLLTAPVMLGCMVFYAVPFLMVFWYSFRSGMGGYSTFTGLENYRSVIENPVFRLAAGNTLKFFLIGLPLILILAYGIALLLKSQVQKFAFMKPVLLFPYIMPVTGTVLLADVFFTASETGLGSILVLYLWKNTGYSMILLLAGLMAIPQEQYNCAKLDGAGEIQMFFYITTPQMWYSLFFTFLFSMINGFKCFREIFLLGGEHPDKQVYMLQHYLNNNFESLNYRNLSAVSVLLFLVITIVLGLAYAGVLRKEAYKS